MSADSVPYHIVLLTARHSIAGELTMHEQRLSDFLNDRRDSAIRLNNTAVARLSEPNKLIQHHTEAVVQKACAMIAFEPPQKAIPHGKRLYGYVRKQRYAVFLMLEGMEVHGILHTSGELDLRRLLATTSDVFLPISQARVVLYANDKFIIEQDTVLVNAHSIRYIAQTTDA